jgi:hypothetical protein
MRILMLVVGWISTLLVGNEKYKALLWDLDYLTNFMIAMIISTTDKDALAEAKEDITHIELLKRVDDPAKYDSKPKLIAALKEETVIEAGIAANMAIFGLIVEHNDKYIGIEQKLEVLQK